MPDFEGQSQVPQPSLATKSRNQVSQPSPGTKSRKDIVRERKLTRLIRLSRRATKLRGLRGPGCQPPCFSLHEVVKRRTETKRTEFPFSPHNASAHPFCVLRDTSPPSSLAIAEFSPSP